MSANAPSTRSRALERAAALCVWLVWAALAVDALRYVARYASPIPLWDDLALVPWAPGDRPLTLGALWEQHNEHRIPLPKLILVLLVRASGDFRAPMALEVALLAGIAAAALLVARRLRGRTSLVDVVHPLAWLHLGHGANLLMGFQVALVLPMALSTGAALLLLGRGDPGTRDGVPATGAVAGAAACAVLLPLSSGAGALHAVVWATCLALLGALAWRSARSGARTGAWVALGGALVTLALVAAYGAGLEQRDTLKPDFERATDLPTQATTAVQVLVLAAGPAGQSLWPWGGVLVVLAALVAAAFLARVALRAPERRTQALALLALLGGVLASVAAIGWSRGRDGGTGFAWRYVVLVAPLATVLALALELAAARRAERAASTTLPGVLSGALALLLAAAWLPNRHAGKVIGAYRSNVHDRLVADVGRGLSTRQLARAHVKECAASAPFLARQLAVLREHSWPPYEDATGPDEPLPGAREAYPMLVSEPDAVEGPIAPRKRRVHDRLVLLVASDTRLVYDLAAGTRRLRGAYGVPPNAWEHDAQGPVTVTVTVETDGAPRELFARELAPREREADRGVHGLDLDLPPGLEGVEGRLVLSASSSDGATAWCFWTALELE